MDGWLVGWMDEMHEQIDVFYGWKKKWVCRWISEVVSGWIDG